MRIATANAYDTGIDTLSRRQADLSALQEQLASGKRVARASDDPAAAARAERALASIGRAETSQRGVDASKAAMTQTESAFSDANNMLQRARELMVAGGNASYADGERKGIADELQSIRDQLLVSANQTDGAGTYIFGGQGSTQKPFLDMPGGVQYAATGGQTLTEPSTGLPLTTNGKDAWLQAATGNGVFVTAAGSSVTGATIDAGRVSDPSAITGASYTLQFTVAGASTTYAVLKNGLATPVTAAPYTSGQAITVDGMSASVTGVPASGDQFTLAPSTRTLGVFGLLDQAIVGLKATGRTGAQISQSTGDNLRNVDSVLSNMQSARSVTGAVLNRIDSETDRLAGQKLAGQTAQSNAEDVDMVHAISDFQNKQSGYDAALKSYAMVQRLSLFQYVNG